MTSYLINLDRSPGRLAAARAEFSAAGCPFVRVCAVDGRTLRKADVRQKASSVRFWLANGRRLKVNELACALSHQACYREGLASDAPYFGVFEDDVTLDGRALALAMERIARENEASRPTVWLLNHRNLVPDPGVASSVRLLGTKDDIMHTWGAEGYVVNRAAAERLLALNAPVRYVADAWPTFARRGIDVRVVFPTACAVRETPSDIARTVTGRAAWRWYQRFGWFKYRLAFRLDILVARLTDGRGQV